MKTSNTKKLLVIASLMAMGSTSAMATDEVKLRADLNGYQQVPSIYTHGVGLFQAKAYKNYINYRIDFQNLTSPLVEAHIHFAQTGANGGTMVIFCDANKPCNTGLNGTVTKQGSVGTIQGILTAKDVQAITGQNVTQGHFNELLKAIANKATYVNLHTSKIDGEVRGQIVVK